MNDTASEQSQGLHVITLLSSTAPVPLPQFDSPRLEGLAVFRSRRVEDGRERFRIHIGYFATAADAEEVLPVVREVYPWAFVGLAPQTNLGSLDDTARSRFTIVRLSGAKAVPRTRNAQPAKPAVAAALATPVTPAAAPPATAPAPVAAPRPAPVEAASPAKPVVPDAPAAAAPAQRYAVQLLWSKQPIDLTRLPDIGIFGGYLLYAVETAPGARRMFGLRLGFYDDELSARLVASYVRPTFKAGVVPVSDREIASARSATVKLPGGRPSRGRAPGQWPRTAVAVAFTDTANDMASTRL